MRSSLLPTRNQAESNVTDLTYEQVVQIYVRLVDSKQSELIKLQLVAFDRVYVPNRSSVTIELVIEQFAAAIWQKSSSSTEGEPTLFERLGGQS